MRGLANAGSSLHSIAARAGSALQTRAIARPPPGIHVGDAAERHHGHRRRRRRRRRRFRARTCKPQPAGPKRRGVHEQHAAAARSGRHRHGELRLRLGVALAPQRRLQPPPRGADAQVQRTFAGAAGDGHGREHAPALAAVLRRRASGRARPSRPGTRTGPSRRSSTPGRSEGSVIANVASCSLRSSRGRSGTRAWADLAAVPAGRRNREHGRAVCHRQALVVERRPLLAPAPARRPRRRSRGRSVCAGGMQNRARGAALRDLPRGHRRGGRRGRRRADRLGPGQPAGRPAHRSGVLRQV